MLKLRYETLHLDELWKQYRRMRTRHPGGRRVLELRNELVKRNYGLVVRVASAHYLKYFNTEVGEDLIASGNLSLISCIPDWDPVLGKFSTFAYRRIWSAMQRAIQREDNVSLYFKQNRNIEVNPASSFKNVEACARANGNEHSLLDDVQDRELRRTISAAMKSMPRQESFILDRRFFHGDSIQAVSDRMGVCKEKIKRIEAEARVRLTEKLRAEPAVMEYLETATVAMAK